MKTIGETGCEGTIAEVSADEPLSTPNNMETGPADRDSKRVSIQPK
jgi:hypothetical protein